MKAGNVEIRWNSVVTELLAGDRLTGVRIRNVQTGEETDIAADGMFVSIGRKPATELVAQQLELDQGATFSLEKPPKPAFPGYMPWATCAPSPSGRWSRPWPTGAVAVHMAEEFLATGI